MQDGRTYSAQRYSPLTQINAKTAGKLGLAWYADLHEALETLGLPASAADALVMEARFTG